MNFPISFIWHYSIIPAENNRDISKRKDMYKTIKDKKFHEFHLLPIHWKNLFTSHRCMKSRKHKHPNILTSRIKINSIGSASVTSGLKLLSWKRLVKNTFLVVLNGITITWGIKLLLPRFHVDFVSSSAKQKECHIWRWIALRSFCTRFQIFF